MIRLCKKKTLYIIVAIMFIVSFMQIPVGTTNKIKAAQIADGYYEIQAKMVHASIKSQPSMGDAAIEKPLGVVIKNGKASLKISFTSLTIKLGAIKYKGYLGELNYLTYSDDDVPTGSEAIYPTTVDEYYDEYDSFNDPQNGTDSYMMSLVEKRYPKKLSMPVEVNDSEIWVQVYVPVMESINEGGGRQYARLQLDWSTLTKIKDLDKEELEKTDTTQLQSIINRAKSCLKQTDTYKTSALLGLQEKIFKAESVLNNTNSTQSEIDDQTNTLIYAIGNLEKIEVVETTQKSEEKSSESESASNNVSKLNKNKLANGTYSITGKMVKTDKKTASMSNEAINHNIKLTVKNNKYYITMSFTGMAINSQFGYLGQLKYFATGYKIDKYGNPTGTTKKTKINTYQKNEDGSLVKDAYGTNYPCQVTFPLIQEAINDGFVPLQVFVPIMEGISKGTGTQPVFLKIDWQTLTKTDKNDKKFKSTTNKKKNESTTNNTESRSSILDMQSSLPQINNSDNTGIDTENNVATDFAQNEQTTNNTFEQNTMNNSLNTQSNGESNSNENDETQSNISNYSGTNNDSSKNTGSRASALISMLAVIAGIVYKIRSRV